MQVRYFLFNTYKYFNMEVCSRKNDKKHEYVNVHHWEFWFVKAWFTYHIEYLVSEILKSYLEVMQP